MGFDGAAFNTVLVMAGLWGHTALQAATPTVLNKKGAADKVQPSVPQQKPGDPQSPNILVIMLDDAGYAQADTFGGEIHTPTLSRIASEGITYNTFHATAISSATRASLLTGRNPHRVGNGTITEIADDRHAGYSGIIPPSAATIPQVLRQKGYASAMFGKWHNTPSHETGPQGPFERWPTGYGFDHFYGFLGGDTDQYLPSLVSGTRAIAPPRDPKYHLTEDLAQKTIEWIGKHQATTPAQPFFVYWAPGGVHAPHQVFAQWTAKYKGKFDSGWDAYRQRAFERQKSIGWIPQNTVNTPRPAELPAWDSLSAPERAFHARQMEVYAGFLEHTDTQAGKIIDELERRGLRKNTLVFYVFSDNGASAEGMEGTISHKITANTIAKTTQQTITALNTMYGGLDALGGPKISQHYNAAWAWAGESPFIGTKVLAGYFGGTRVPLAVSWPEKITPSREIRTQFHHVNDIASTIYDVAGVKPPQTLSGVPQLPLDGVSMVYSFQDAKAANPKKQQYFEMMGSRAEYSDGWIASVWGPRTPWVSDASKLISWPAKVAYFFDAPWIGDTFGWLKWNAQDDHWALYDLRSDFSQSNDVSAKYPEKLAELRKKFDQDALSNNVYPLGAGYARAILPKRGAQKEWHFGADARLIPELASPNIRSRDNEVLVEAEFPENANGVLFKYGNTSAGIALFVKDGYLTYEYNGFAFDRTVVRAPQRLPAGKATVAVELAMASRMRTAAANVSLKINGKEVAAGKVPLTAPAFFSHSATFDVGLDSGPPVSLLYYDQAPFAFNGKIRDVAIRYK
ncbi:MAG: arylsulfatase [Rhodoferax sp.]